MSNAKHRDIVAQREYKAMIRKFERAEKHEAMLKQHKEWKKHKNSGNISIMSEVSQ